MAGYIGSKTSVTVTSPETDSRYVNTTGDTMTGGLNVLANVGIGTSSPSAKLDVVSGGTTSETIAEFGNANISDGLSIKTNGNLEWGFNAKNSRSMTFSTNQTERMRIDSNGNLLVSKTASTGLTAGCELRENGMGLFTRSSANPMQVRRLTNDGDLVEFYKDSTEVGSISASGGDLVLGTTDVGMKFNDSLSAIYPYHSDGTTGSQDNLIDLGYITARWDDIYATNGTIQTSDANEKQQIAELTAAEMQAAKAISKLFKTFKWNDSVAEKGDAARTHTGVIAQEVEAAMTAAGLNAGDYAFFISTDWVDEETGEPRNRKGIRYPQLLAFIGAATEQRLASIEARLDALETV